MDEQAVDREQLLGSLPPFAEGDLSRNLRKLIGEVGRKVIVLDDDPTGTQTVHDIPVVTRWSVDHLARELLDSSAASYVLTNSRSLVTREAIALNREIGRNLRAASARTGRGFVVVSRSDSTLRGHFPEEPETLAAGLGESFDAWVLCPFFEEGGRLTINDVHYVAEGDRLVPAAQTPFAADAAFGYRNSNLRDWVVERSGGHIPRERVESLSIEELRRGEPEALKRKLTAMPAGSVVIVNAAERRDLEAALQVLVRAEAQGKRFLYRTAASFVAVRAGIEPRSLLEPDELAGGGTGVLVVAGSYVPKTTEQLRHLVENSACTALELEVSRVLDDSTREKALAEIAGKAASGLAADAVVVVYTSRQFVGSDQERGLAIGRRISEALVDLVQAISVRPRVLVGKGGITSSDLATEACEVERATVMGQILHGVPVWRCGPESRYPGMPLVVFPGNVGAPEALTDLVAMLARK